MFFFISPKKFAKVGLTSFVKTVLDWIFIIYEQIGLSKMKILAIPTNIFEIANFTYFYAFEI